MLHATYVMFKDFNICKLLHISGTYNSCCLLAIIIPDWIFIFDMKQYNTRNEGKCRRRQEQEVRFKAHYMKCAVHFFRMLTKKSCLEPEPAPEQNQTPTILHDRTKDIHGCALAE